MPDTKKTEQLFQLRHRAASMGVITRQQNPINVEFPFEALESFQTPSEQFYVRSHFAAPTVDAKTFRLRVEGHLERPIELSLDDLRQMAAVSRPSTLECAGNGRVFLVPQVEGAQWELGAVSTARWTGVSLAEVLAKAGIKPGAVEVMFEGADRGKPKEKPLPPGEINYAHSIPLRKIDDAMLAYEMNGQPLSLNHGFPLRVVVGGWYGMASVKWVQRIVVLPEPFRGYFRSVDYAHWVELAGNPVHVPIEEMSCKAQIARPAKFEVVPRDTNYEVIGAAWTGDTDVVGVDVSTDNGKLFQPATLLGDPLRHAWRFWKFDWKTPASAGNYILLARATDARGRVQPSNHDPHHGSYIIDQMLPTEVEVR